MFPFSYRVSNDDDREFKRDEMKKRRGFETEECRLLLE